MHKPQPPVDAAPANTPKADAPAGFEPRSEDEANLPLWAKQILHGMRTADPDNPPETP